MSNLLDKVYRHHKQVQEKLDSRYGGGSVIMTVLIGSQNYHLDTENSDIDTYSFILPNFFSFICGDAPTSFQFDVEDGICTVKDMRLALNLLRKPSPNSVECFVSENVIYNEDYKPILEYYLKDQERLRFITHSNFKQMLDGIAGTARMLHGRNMTLGKKFSHCLRLEEMYKKYMNLKIEPKDYLTMDIFLTTVARLAKISPEIIKENIYIEQCKRITDELTTATNNFQLNSFQQDYQEKGQELINCLQEQLFEVYLGENGYEKKN